MALGDLTPIHGALLVWAMAIILPMPLPFAQAAVWPSGASVISVTYPITIAFAAIVFALLLIFEGGATAVSPLTLLLGAFYS